MDGSMGPKREVLGPKREVLGLDKVKYVLYFYLIKRDIIHLNISLYLIVIVIYVY